MFPGVEEGPDEGEDQEKDEGQESAEEGVEEWGVGIGGLGNFFDGAVFQSKEVFQGLVLSLSDQLELFVVKGSVVFQLDAVDKVGKGNGAKMVAN